MSDENVQATAYHEAGHAVAAIVRGIGFHYVTIVHDDEDDSHGHVNYGAVPARLNAGNRAVARELRDRLVVNQAGAIAEERFLGHRNDIGAAADDEWFRECLWDMYGENGERHARTLAQQARQLVAQHWSAMSRVANALLKEQTLTEEAVERLVNEG